MVILRTQVFGERERTLATRLQKVGGHPMVVAVDETRGAIDVSPFEKISVNERACAKLGLHCPQDFTWRNGDYVFYLARNQYPEQTYFWMIEPDVEHSFASDEALFKHFDKQSDVDLLVPYFRVSTEKWWWRQTARPRSTGVKRAMFCFLRLSAKAVDVCLRERQSGRFSLRDRLCWPNDEAFVATEIVYAGLTAADLNDFGAPTYTLETLGYDEPIDGSAGTFRQHPDCVYHPVLYGSAYRARKERIGKAEGSSSCRKNLGRKLQRALG